MPANGTYNPPVTNTGGGGPVEIPILTTNPVTIPGESQMWINSTNNTINIFNGTSTFSMDVKDDTTDVFGVTLTNV